jgi:hypothetical protein
MERWSHRIALTLAALVLAVGVDLVHAEIPSTLKSAKGEAFVPQPQLAKFASLGFDSLAADYYWLQAIQLVGGAVADPSKHGYTIGRLIDVLTQLNPHVDHPYRFAAIWMTASEDDVRFANQLMQRGIERHPQDWRNHFYKGFNHFYYLKEYAEAADELEAATRLPGSPPYLTRLVPRLRAHSEGLDVAAALLQELHRNAPGEKARAEYAKALDEIHTERRARRLDAAREEYQRRRGRDIERVEDLLAGPDPVLQKLPEELHGWEWVVDGRTGRIVSSFYGARYQVYEQYRPGKFTPSAAQDGSEDTAASGRVERGSF